MDRFPNPFLHASGMHERERAARRISHHEGEFEDQSESRQFVFHPIVGQNKQSFGCQAQFRAGWEDDPGVGADVAARIMIDNWLLFGFEELNGSRPVFLDCTREMLMSGFLWLLPPRWAIFKIAESVEPSPEVRSACSTLKGAGYRFALDDFASPKNMNEFLDLADFIEVDFKHAARRKRACMLRRLHLTYATLIAVNIESEEDFQQAGEEGFALFQGYFFGERISFVKKGDRLDPIHCNRILEALQARDPLPGELAELVDLESGIQRRLLRRANWVTPPEVAINSNLDAIEVVETRDLQQIVSLAMTAASSRLVKHHPLSAGWPSRALFGPWTGEHARIGGRLRRESAL